MYEAKASVEWPKERICERLQAHSLWKVLPTSELLQLISAGTLHQASPGVTLWEQSKGRPRDLFVLIEGVVEISEELNNSLALTLSSGGCFGMAGLASEETPDYCALAASEVVWLELLVTEDAHDPSSTEVASSPCSMPPPASPLEALFEANPSFQETLSEALSFAPNVDLTGGWIGGANVGPMVMIQQMELASHGYEWGTMLDAGTGRSSLQWILQLPVSKWTAVTYEERQVEWPNARFKEKMRPDDRLIIGDWRDPELLKGEVFDVVLLDYVIGAIECFAPHYQEGFLHRIRPHVGRRMYLIGFGQPLDKGNTEGSKMLYELYQLRDACLLLSGMRPFREFPLSWTREALARTGFRIEGVQSFPLKLGERFVHSFLNDCLRLLLKSNVPEAAAGLAEAIQRFRRDAMQVPELRWGIPYGEDYLISAIPI